MSCMIADCNKPAVARGWCNAHYLRWKRHGDPLGGSTGKGEPQRFFREVVMTYDGDGCLNWPFSRNHAGHAQLYYDGMSRPVCRIVCAEQEGQPPTPDHEAAHSCGNGHEGCCSRHHVRWATPKENNADKLLHGTHNRGRNHISAKLTAEAVREIRKLKGRVKKVALAERYGVSDTLIYHIQQRNSWKWLE